MHKVFGGKENPAKLRGKTKSAVSNTCLTHATHHGGEYRGFMGELEEGGKARSDPAGGGGLVI